MNIYIYPDKDDFNKGRIRIEFLNIHSTEDSLLKQKKDMDEFFADYKKDARDIAEAFSMTRHEARLLHQKEISTDGEITGEFRSIVAVLAGILDNCDYKMEGNTKKFSFYRKNPGNDNSNLNVSIQYQGKILSNNSKQYDSRNGIMRWSLNKTGDREIIFSIESPK